MAQDLPWRQYQGDARHRGYQAISLGANDFQLAWEIQIGQGRALGAAILEDNRAYFNVSNGPSEGIYAVDLETGSVIWEQLYGFTTFTGPIGSWRGEQLCFLSEDGSINTWIRVLDAQNGDPVTLLPVEQPLGAYLAPTCDRGQVYSPGGDTGGVYGMTIGTRTVDWYYDLAGYDEQWTPAADDLLGVFCYTGGNFAAFDPDTGAVFFDVIDPGYIAGVDRLFQAPVIGEIGNVLVTNNGRLVSFSQVDGSIDWEVLEFFSGQVSLAQGEIWVVNGGSLDVRAESDGNLLYRYIPNSGVLSGAIALTDTHAFFCDEDETFAMNRDSKMIEWSYPMEGALSIGEGYLTIANDDGILAAVDLGHLPTPEELTPFSVEFFHALGTSVTIEGFGFEDPLTTEVYFGNLAASNVQVLDEYTLTCDLPDLGPGAVEVRVVDASGSVGLEYGFAATPAVRAEGDFLLGESVRVIVDNQPSDDIYLYYDFSAPFSQGQAQPPFLGERFLASPTLLLSYRDWAFSSLSRQVQLPDNPSFAGRKIALQALSGPSVPGLQAAFSNLFIIEVQP